MTERPIIFDAESVRAILAKRKTMTRRIIKPQPEWMAVGDGGCWTWSRSRGTGGETLAMRKPYLGDDTCPYGKPGDRLYVKETWTECNGEIAYLANTLNKYGHEDADSKQVRLDYGIKWKSPLFMPRRLSRITLEVVSVRVERLHDITEAGALCEGIEVSHYYCEEPTLEREGVHRCDPIGKFAERWDAINKARGFPWAGNWWVRMVEFKLLGGE